MKPSWRDRPEGGSVLGLRILRSFALLCGRSAARLVLYPITAYYLIRRGPERRASRDYLQRVLGRKATLMDVARHIYVFAAVILDRVFLLSERFRRFDVRTVGLDALRGAWSQKRGVLIFGSHLGSFEALRVLAQFRDDVKTRVLIDVQHNRRMFEVLGVLNPQLAASVIDAGQDGTSTALAIKEALDEASLVAMLIDRARPGNALVEADFLGAAAMFPTAPWLLAAALKVPVVLCFGLYRGGNRYDFHFELFAESVAIPRNQRQQHLEALIQRYADRLAHHARSAPYNWFNFYDFWHHQNPGESLPVTERTDHSAARRA